VRTRGADADFENVENADSFHVKERVVSSE
jgi:hypothetical protein